MRTLIVTLSAVLMLLSIAPQAGAAKSHLKCGGDNLQCGSLAKVCNLKNGKCCCMDVSREVHCRELNFDFELIDDAFKALLQSHPDPMTADKVADLRNKFRDAFTGWLEIEEAA